MHKKMLREKFMSYSLNILTKKQFINDQNNSNLFESIVNWLKNSL